MSRSPADPAEVRTSPLPVPWRPGGGPTPRTSRGAAEPAVEVTGHWQPESLRRKIERWSICWLVSAVVNLLILLTATILLIPHVRAGGPFTLIATADAEEGDLERLMSETADTASLDFGVELEVTDLEIIEPQEVRVELELAGGSVGEGQGGWQDGIGTGGEGGGTDYFGTVASGNDFVYVLDKSGSMTNTADVPGAVSRFTRAKYELLRSIDKLAPYQSFYVMLFSDTTVRMFSDKSPNPTVIPATRDNKQRLREWLREVRAEGGTDPREALYLAMSMSPDAIFFLSDGDFRVSRRGRPQRFFNRQLDVEELVEKMHRGYSPIHTFAYENPECKQRMETVARLTGGEYKYIPPNEVVINVPAQR